MDRHVSRGRHAGAWAPPCPPVEACGGHPMAGTPAGPPRLGSHGLAPPAGPPRPPTLRNLYRRKVNQLVSIFSATDSVLEQRHEVTSGPPDPHRPRARGQAWPQSMCHPATRVPGRADPKQVPRVTSAVPGLGQWAHCHRWAGRGVGGHRNAEGMVGRQGVGRQGCTGRGQRGDRKSTRLNSIHRIASRMPSSA